MWAETFFLVLCLTSTFAKPQQRDVSSGYDDNMARRFFHVAAAAYPDDSAGGTANRTMCLDKAFPYMNWQIVDYQDFECDSNKGRCRGFIAVSNGSAAASTPTPVTSAPDVTSTTDQPTTTPFPLIPSMPPTVFISFRGTEGGDQFEQEINDGARDPRVYYDFPPGKNGQNVSAGGINKYFNDAGDKFWARFSITVNKYKATHNFKCTGHSLGAALASYYCFRLVFSNSVIQEKVQVISFGEPRLGDEDYANSFNQYLPNSFRVVHYRDPIAHLPPASFKGTDGLHMRHHRQEIWYDQNDMSVGAHYVQCGMTGQDGSAIEDSDCSNQLFNNVVSNIWHFFKDGGKMHVHYFEHVIPGFGNNGCVDSASGLSTFVAICLSLLTVLRIA